MNLAIDCHLNRTIDINAFNEDENISVHINETIVMIYISGKMIFNSGSYR